MSLELIPTPEFIRSAKRLHKKYRLLYKDLELLRSELTQDQKLGTDLGAGCFKMRLPNSSIPTGKSGGFRVIYLFRNGEMIYLLDIYTNTELESISEERLLDILKTNGLT